MSQPDKKVWIVTGEEIVTDTDTAPGARGGHDVGGGFGERVYSTLTRRIAVDPDHLKGQMEDLLSVVERVFSRSEAQTGLCLQQVELSIEISSEGQISIIGNGGKIGAQGAIRLTFKRSDKAV